MIQNKKQNNTKKGFTLIETLVAIFILLITTTGPLTFAQSGLRASFVARDQVVAFYLAQDAIETIKSLRDNASLEGADWLRDILPACINAQSGNGCKMDTRSHATPLQQCNSQQCPVMQFDETAKQFVTSGGTPTKFARTVYLKEVTPDELQIIVEVTWDTNFFADRRIIVQENIYNWVPEFSS